jgi:hypothetical protein
MTNKKAAKSSSAPTDDFAAFFYDSIFRLQKYFPRAMVYDNRDKGQYWNPLPLYKVNALRQIGVYGLNQQLIAFHHIFHFNLIAFLKNRNMDDGDGGFDYRIYEFAVIFGQCQIEQYDGLFVKRRGSLPDRVDRRPSVYSFRQYLFPCVQFRFIRSDELYYPANRYGSGEDGYCDKCNCYLGSSVHDIPPRFVLRSASPGLSNRQKKRRSFKGF